MYVYLGDLIGDLAKLEMSSSALNPEVEVARWSIKLASFIATVAIAIYLSILAKKYLNRYL